MIVPYVLVNFSIDSIFLPKGESLGKLDQNTEIGEVEKKFITSPSDVEVHRRINLQNAKVTEEDLQKFKKLCEEYDDIFSKDSTDIGRTPFITMETDTGDSPPTSQRPYNLPLKHSDWVQKELDTLEKAGVITRSVSPWASPTVIVPKKRTR